MSLSTLLVGLLDELLRPRGFVRRGGLWRKNGERAVIVLRLWEELGDHEVDFVAWIKALGDVDPLTVKPGGGNFHVGYELDSDFLPEELQFKVMRALNFARDYADDVERAYGSGQQAARIASYFEPHEPLTDTWRVAVLREAMENYVLPWFDRVEAADQDVIAEKRNKEARLRQTAADGAFATLKECVGKCRQWKREGLSDRDLVRALQKELLTMPKVALALAIGLEHTIDEAKNVIAASGVWTLQWKERHDEELQKTIESSTGLLRLPDGHVKFR